MAPSSLLLSLFVVVILASSSPAVLSTSSSGDNDEGLTHIHLYIHEKFAGENATAMPVLSSPLGVNSTFGSMSVVDNELRVGRDRSSQLLGRFQAFFVGTSQEMAAGYQTSNTLVFTAGEHAGSTVSVQGPVLGFDGVIERAVVGGTGKFRMARGYSLTKILGYPTPETAVVEFDLFVLMHNGKY